MRPSLLAQMTPLGFNPLDQVEDVLLHRDVDYDRPVEDEIVAEMPGAWGSLKLWYRWEEAMQMLVFTCAMENKITKAQRAKVYPLLAAINERLWLGHFDLTADEGIMIFRYSMLMRTPEDVNPEHLETLLEIGATECNRVHPAVQSVIWGNQGTEEALDMAMFETMGEA